MPERRKRAAVAAATSATLASSAALAAVKALVLLLQSIDLGRVHFSCAFFLYYEQSRSLHSSNGKCCLPVARRHLSKS